MSPHNEHAQPGETRKAKSAFVVALAAFVAFNCLLSFFTPIEFDKFKFPYKGWAWWTFSDLKGHQGSHNVALLGSSLMVSAVAGTDANHLQQKLDLTSYHKASYLDHKLRTMYGGSFDTYNLSAPGQMPSDAYLALRAMVDHGNRPEAVIYGIAPRDFIDSMLNNPADTEQFKYLSRLVNISDVSGRYFRNPFARLEWWLQQHVYLYGAALDAQMVADEATTEVLGWIAPQPYRKDPFTWWDRCRLLPRYKVAEFQSGATVTEPVTFEHEKKIYIDNTREYQERYRSPDLYTYKTQEFFLNKIAQFCHKERIELILVNMPITFYNANMLAPGKYPEFVANVQQLAIRNNVTFYNLADFSAFPQEYFHDSVHMNAFGGTKFFDRLVQAIASDRRASTAMAMAGQELQRRRDIVTAQAKNVKPIPAGRWQ